MDLPRKNFQKSIILLLHVVGGILLAALFGMFFFGEKPVDTDVTSDTTDVGLVLVGIRNDNNYTQAHYDAIMSLKDELNLNIICRENIPEDEECFNTIKELIEKDGCKVIIAPSFGYAQYVKELAGIYPNVCFIQPMGTESQLNMATCLGRMYQARYLAGIVAGMRTGTGEIGYAAAFSIPEVIGQINAFTLGVRSVVPDARVHVDYIGSWTDDNAAETVCERMLDKYPDIDVLTMHTNSLMPDKVAADKGIWSIGFNKDNSHMFPDSYLTACVWDWEDYYRDILMSCLQGKFYGRYSMGDMNDGMVVLSDLTANCLPGTKEAVEKAVELFKNRSFDVFYGPVTDNAGALRIPAGESMSDDELLNRLDWYVEGVTVEE